MLVFTGYVGLATMLSGAGLIAAVYVLDPDDAPLLCFCAAVTAFVVFTHRGNIARMRAGQESRVRRLWLFRSRA